MLIKNNEWQVVSLSFSSININEVPPPSTPSATGHNPADTTAADPLEEPPAILLALCGFLVALWSENKQPSSCHQLIQYKFINI